MRFSRYSVFPVVFAWGWLLSLVPALAELPEPASRAWLPGAMVEVEIKERIMETTESMGTRMVDLRVEVTEVFTGPEALKGSEILINPYPAHRSPPERWSALGELGIMGSPIENYPLGQRGLLWIFQRGELLTGEGQGREYSFFHGFSSVWKWSTERHEERVKQDAQQWKDTRAMMEALGFLEDLDEEGKGEAIVGMLEDQNPLVRRWALAAVLRVKGIGAIPLLEQLRNSEIVGSELTETLGQHVAGRSWQKPVNKPTEILKVDPWLGVEVVTRDEKSEEKSMLAAKKKLKLGTVKVLRVFSGSGVEVGEILPAQTGDFEVGSKWVVVKGDGEIALKEQGWHTLGSFPPRGRWDGEGKCLGSKFHRMLDLELAPFLPWLRRMETATDVEAIKFLDEAVRSAPLQAALWAVRSHPSLEDSEAMKWLENRVGVDSAEEETEASLRNFLLYDFAMMRRFGRLWIWGEEREDLMGQVFSHPLADDEEAWLLTQMISYFWESGSETGTAEKWARLAEAARENPTWRTDWSDPTCRRILGHTTWFCTWAESRAAFDASPAVEYLLQRWAIPDRDEKSTAMFTDSCGAQLARSLPLKPEEVEELRAALSARLSASDDPVDQENYLSGIRALTWEEILAQPFP